ncbi:MAG: hypothetical protein K0U47_12160 [Epsilonproteobacteria bacterium]|nr:hypothetical protein [Campylobacterota bacterium]
MKKLLLSLCCIVSLHAENLDWYVELNIGRGGDKLASIGYTNGDTANLYAGGGVGFTGGILFVPKTTPELQTLVSIGYMFDSADASNGDVTFGRFPLSVIQYYVINQWRVGVGATYHMSPTLESDGFGYSDEEVDFDNGLGALAEIDYLFPSGMIIGFRATLMEYEYRKDTIDGNRYAAVLGYKF